MEEMEQVIRIFPQRLRGLLLQADTPRFPAEELRLRVGQPLLMRAKGQEWYLEEETRQWRAAMGAPSQGALRVTEADVRDTLEFMSRYSLYAFHEELRQGFLTISGGHRIGVAGQAVLEGGRVKNILYPSFLNVRIARQVMGCGDGILPWIYEEGNFCSTLLISPPRCGKTTLLRDLIRQVSDGWQDKEHGQFIGGVTVGVVDERSELGACCQGRPQNDLGIRTDVLDACPKAEGIMMLIRSMAPQVVAVDEIGSIQDLEAIRYGKNCGCQLLATVHGHSLEDIRKKPVLKEFVQEGVFKRFVILSSQGGPGRVEMIFDEFGRCLKQEKHKEEERNEMDRSVPGNVRLYRAGASLGQAVEAAS